MVQCFIKGIISEKGVEFDEKTVKMTKNRSENEPEKEKDYR